MAAQILSHASIIAAELKVRVSQVEAAIQLIDEGATVPFIARYRKEATGSLDDIALRHLDERLVYLRELDDRRGVIIQSIKEQEKLTPELLASISAADTKTRLEDLYLPYRPKRRTKAQLAREAGLQPLADMLYADPTLCPEDKAQAFINAEAGIDDVATALTGARQILMEQFSEDAALINELREYLWKHALLKAKVSDEKHPQAKKYSDYFSYQEPLHKIPSHRALALFRGRRENVLQLTLTLQDEAYPENRVSTYFNVASLGRPADEWLKETVKQAWKLKLLTKLELELLTRLREAADDEAIKVFAKNLRDLLMAAPAGSKVTMGLDPGIRTGVKVCVVDATGKLLDYATVYPFAPQNEWYPAIAELAKLCAKHRVDLISIGNGTGSRDTERLVAELMKMYADLPMLKVVVNEAGASVYSASALASAEFPDLDVSIRGAVSIARRLQDPLAELVKIEPKSIGVGQYQHDVNQSRMARTLEGVVEDCVNWVGVDLNTASVPLLTRVSGLNEGLAKQVVQYRDEHGAFKNREQLKLVPRMGDKTFQQAAGFLRIAGGDNPLDGSSVHPETYAVVEKILASLNTTVTDVMTDPSKLKAVNAADFVDNTIGLATIQDIIKELEKPGRDPRPAFKMAKFKEGIEDISHLQVGMMLEGVVSNVTNFGAFVDVGVHQDGLVHISMLTNRFIDDPHKVVKAGDIVTVKVVEVDVERRRVGLSMRFDEEKAPTPLRESKPKRISKPIQKPVQKPAQEARPVIKKTVFNTSMADAFAKLKQGKS